MTWRDRQKGQEWDGTYRRNGACQTWALRSAPYGGPAKAPCGLYADQHTAPLPQPCTCLLSCGYSCKGECGCSNCAQAHQEFLASQGGAR